MPAKAWIRCYRCQDMIPMKPYLIDYYDKIWLCRECADVWFEYKGIISKQEMRKRYEKRWFYYE